jgi:hypothetical protein
MKTQIDIKSALCGLVIGVLAMFAVGAEQQSSNPAGRYQTASGSGFITIIDTTTGQAWCANLAAPIPGFQQVDAGFWDSKLEAPLRRPKKGWNEHD